MLLTLSVKNFAIIDTIEIEFDNGLSVITGETGAGKSLIIDSIGLLFGQRASSEMIRHGEDKATIEGLFHIKTNSLAQTLQDMGISFSDELLIKREIYASGKSISRINGSIVTLTQLQEISESLGDIHSQFDTRGLIHPKNYLTFLEDEALKLALSHYQAEHAKYVTHLKRYQGLVARNQEDGAKIEFLKYQIKELDQAQLSVLEEEELQEQFKQLSNFELMLENMAEATSSFSDNSVLDNIYTSLQALKRLSQYDTKYQSYAEQIEDMYYQLTDIYEDISVDLKTRDFDPAALDFINERLGLYSSLKRKYKKTTEELLAYLTQMQQEISDIENYDSLLQEYLEAVEASYQTTYEIACKLSDIRKQNAIILQKQIKEHLLDLELKQSEFLITVTSNEKKECLHSQTFFPTCIDGIEFLVTFNKGEPLKPLAKVASGGEMSRFMLSLKTAMFTKVPVETIIFDEIDTGVSGEIAYKIAQKMKEISKDRQVFCITHLPQVAASGDHHLHIKKQTIDSKTITVAERLDENMKIEEIAKMISKGDITSASRNLAKELLSR